MRLFVGIGLPEECRRAIDAAASPMRERRLPVSWVPPENLHLTLKFLGEVAPDRIGSVRSALAVAAGSVPPFDLLAEGGGVFPGVRAPRVLWTGFREPLELVGRLQENMEMAFFDAGFPREGKPFHPHVTVGRVRGATPPGWGGRFLAALSGRSFGVVPATSFQLYESRLSPSRARYAVIEEFPLAGPAGPQEKEK